MGSVGIVEFGFLLQGLKWTLALAAIGFVGGGVFGLIVALLRTARSPLLRALAGGYVSLFQGTPLLMQLFVVYYGIALVGVRIDSWAAVALALTAHASAFLGEIWRGGIEAVPKGQTEAANALGLHFLSRLKDVVLPQAIRISLPATIGLLVQLIKGTSLASIVGFVELTRAGNILSNQIFQPLLIFGIVGALYFAVCWPLSLFGSYLERQMAKGDR